MGSEVVELLISDILADEEFNCRGSILPMDVQDLVEDIPKNGLLSNIIVQPCKVEGYKYKVVCGHRRHLAMTLLKHTHIRAEIRPDITANQAMIINLQENLRRKDLNILQEANALQRFVDRGYKIKDMQKVLDQPYDWINTRLKLLKLPEDIQKKAAAGLLTQFQIKEIAELPTPTMQFAAARKCIDHKLHGDTRAALRITKKRTDPNKKKVRDLDEVHQMQDHWRTILGDDAVTIILGWVGGYVSTQDVFELIRDNAHKRTPLVYYAIPASLEEARVQ